MTQIIDNFKLILTEWQKSAAYQQNLADFGSEIELAFNSPISDEKISEIEELLGEPLPADLVELYKFADGGADFIGDTWISSEKIISELKWSAEQKKPEHPVIENPAASAALEKDITAFYRTLAPKNGFFGKKNWYKMEFGGSPHSLSGPVLYKTPQTTDMEREIVEISSDFQKQAYKKFKALYLLEKAGYNWDELECVIFADGRDQIERRNFNFESDFSSFPEKAVKIKYFWDKWLPIFDDGGGNFIGLDFDTDCAGSKGQVMIYGRDEDELTVLAPNLSSFFEKILTCLQDERRGEIFSNHHIHDVLRNLVKAGKF